MAYVPGRLATEVSGAEVSVYLGAIDRMGFPAWQLGQVLEALQRFGRYRGCAWVDEVDWAAWRARWVVPESGISLAVIERGILPEDSVLRSFVVRLRVRQLSYRTQKTYLEWVERCLKFHGLESASNRLAEEHIGPFLTHLAAERQVGASTQRQALNALVSFFQEVYGRNSVDAGAFIPAATPRQVPTVLSVDEVRPSVGATRKYLPPRDQGPGTRDQGPGTREQRPGTRDQGPGTRDQGAEARDQRPETRDQGPETRDQGPGTSLKSPTAHQ